MLIKKCCLISFYSEDKRKFQEGKQWFVLLLHFFIEKYLRQEYFGGGNKKGCIAIQ